MVFARLGGLFILGTKWNFYDEWLSLTSAPHVLKVRGTML